MQLVVEISEDTFFDLKKKQNRTEVDNAVLNGTPLPKGHGTSKDVDNIKTAFPSGEYVRTESVRATIDHEETVIEADKAESEKWVNFADDLIPIIDEAESKE